MNTYMAESQDERSHQYPDPRFDPDYSRMVNSYVMEDYPEDMGYGPPYGPTPGGFHPDQFRKPSRKKPSRGKGGKSRAKKRPQRKYSSADQSDSYDEEDDFNQRSVQIYDR